MTYLGALFQLRVLDASVVDTLQAVYQHLLGHVDIVERDGAVLEVAVADLSVDEAVHQVRGEAASTVSAIIRMACSRVNGLGPG